MTAREILQALGGRWHGSYGMVCCPVHEDRTPSLKVVDGDDGDVILHCFSGCSWQDVKDALRRQGVLPEHRNLGHHDSLRESRQGTRRDHRDEDAERKREAALRVWREAGPVDDTRAEVYLRERGIRPPIPPSLRYHRNLTHGPTGLSLPAMVAAVQGPDRKITGIHRTFLTMDGTNKSPVASNKMMLGRCAGGAVRLAAVAEKLALTEGIETSLSVMQATDIPTWACLSTSGLKAVILPDEVREVIICADGDEAGEKAANDAAQRFLREGRDVRIARAPAGMDFNDLLMLPENVVPLDARKREPAHG